MSAASDSLLEEPPLGDHVQAINPPQENDISAEGISYNEGEEDTDTTAEPNVEQQNLTEPDPEQSEVPDSFARMVAVMQGNDFKSGVAGLAGQIGPPIPAETLDNVMGGFMKMFGNKDMMDSMLSIGKMFGGMMAPNVQEVHNVSQVPLSPIVSEYLETTREFIQSLNLLTPEELSSDIKALQEQDVAALHVSKLIMIDNNDRLINAAKVAINQPVVNAVPYQEDSDDDVIVPELIPNPDLPTSPEVD